MSKTHNNVIHVDFQPKETFLLQVARDLAWNFEQRKKLGWTDAEAAQETREVMSRILGKERFERTLTGIMAGIRLCEEWQTRPWYWISENGQIIDEPTRDHAHALADLARLLPDHPDAKLCQITETPHTLDKHEH